MSTPTAEVATASWTDVRWGLQESDWRELYYCHAGDFSQAVLQPGSPWWLGAMHMRAPLAPDAVSEESLRGENTFIHCSEDSLDSIWPTLALASSRQDRGMRLMVWWSQGTGP